MITFHKILLFSLCIENPIKYYEIYYLLIISFYFKH